MADDVPERRSHSSRSSSTNPSVYIAGCAVLVLTYENKRRIIDLSQATGSNHEPRFSSALGVGSANGALDDVMRGIQMFAEVVQIALLCVAAASSA